MITVMINHSRMNFLCLRFLQQILSAQRWGKDALCFLHFLELNELSVLSLCYVFDELTVLEIVS